MKVVVKLLQETHIIEYSTLFVLSANILNLVESVSKINY
jgi:hypothetical protein